jgi:hypothetical protein
VDEGRKRVLLIAASILAARKLAQLDGPRQLNSPAAESAMSDAVMLAERIMRRIDAQWPEQSQRAS